MQKRNATVAVIGAGDFIGGEIAKKFASEGFTVFAGRRNGAKLEPLVKEIEKAGGEIHARSLDARKEEEIISFLEPRVAKWWLPDDVVFIDEVPKTSVGKFSKKTLREQFSEVAT